jgi:glycine betaine/proline transport system permease protein
LLLPPFLGGGASCFPDFRPTRQGLQVSTAAYWDALVEYLNVHFFDAFEAVKTVVLVNFLVPVKRFLLAQPWPWGTAVIGAAAWAVAGLRRGIVAGLFCLFIAFSGLWEPAMVTLYLVGVSVLIAAISVSPLAWRPASTRGSGALSRASSIPCRRCRASSTLFPW